jgi:phosphatidylglycerophosphate synthase
VTGELERRLLGRHADPVATQVLVLVDPEQPGAAELRLPGGELLVVHVGELAVREAGEPAGPVVREPSVTASVDQVASALRRRSDVPLAVVDAATVATGTSLGDVVADPRSDSAVLRGTEGRVVAVRVPSADRTTVARALHELLGREPRTRVLELLAEACAVAGVPTVDRSDDALPVVLATDAGTLEAAWSTLSSLDEARLRLRRAQRSDDGFLSTFLVRPISRRVTPVAVRWGVAPSTVTGVALVLGLLAAAAYALAGTGHTTVWRLGGSVLLLASLVVDCVDGEVARSTRTASARGGWLDVGADRVKEYAVYAGLAAGVAGNARTEWWLAFAAMALLVARHFVDFGYAAATRSVTAPGATRRRVGPAAVTGRAGGVAGWSQRTSARPAAKWAKRAVIMPVGERTLLLIVLAPLVGVRVTLALLLALGVVAAVWTTAGRLGRTVLAGRGAGGELDAGGEQADEPADPRVARLVAQVDAAPVPIGAWLVLSAAGWLLPALARVVEQAAVAGLVLWLAPSALPGAFAWLAVVVFGLYDVVYRQRLAGASDSPGLLGGVPFGWPVRVLLVLVLLLASGEHAGAVLTVAGALLAVAVLTSSGRFWGAQVPSTP